MHLRICWGSVGGQEQIRRANKFEGKGGPHVLNLNLWLVGQGQQVRDKSSVWRETERLTPIAHCSETDGEIGHRDDVTAILPGNFSILSSFTIKKGLHVPPTSKLDPGTTPVTQ